MTLLVSFPEGSRSFAFSASTFLAVAILFSYSHSCHVSLGPPIDPSIVVLVFWFTFANGET